MNVEERRLRTFQNWPANAAVDPQRIAKAGFYYTGRDLEVQCFCCGGRIEDWNYGDQVMARHRRLSPGCPFVNNPASSGNVPICGAPRDSTVPSTVGSSVSTQSSPSSSSGASSLPASLLTLGLFDQTTQFRSEAARLSTFENWPVGHIVTPEQLAKAGFYYQGSGDKVKCAFCSGVVGYWEDGDEPEKEHRRHFPQCPFLYNIPVGNIPISAESGEPCSRLGVRDAQTDNNPKLAMKELGIQSHHGPRNPKYATVESRLRTYSDWPSGVTQKPDDLAAAGFYYSGTGDQVRCFHCDGGLRLWDPSDDPWMEHARWFNSCGYVTLVKGEQFVKQAVVHHTPPSVPSVPSMLDTGAPLSAQKKIQAHKHPVTERDLQALMCTEPVIAALGTGLDMSRIKMALRQKLEETGLPFTSPDALIEAALECQHEEVAAQDTRLDTETPSLPRIHHWRQRGQSDVEIDDENSWETETEEEDDNGTAQHVMRGQQQQQQQHATNTQQNTILQRNDRQASPLQGSPQCAMSQSMPSLLQTDTSLATTQNENAPEKSGPSYISCRQSLPVLPSMAEDRFQKGSKVSLEEENRRLKEARQCKICMDSEACVVFLPCGHLVTCVNCAPSLSDCPICRQPIKATVRTFLS